MNNTFKILLISLITSLSVMYLYNSPKISSRDTVDYITNDNYKNLFIEEEVEKVKELVADYYVAKWGDDLNSGTDWASAVKTIQTAIDKCSSDETILVSVGVYDSIAESASTNAVICGNTNLTITVKSAFGPESTIIDGMGSNRCVFGGSVAKTSEPYGYLTVDGFTLKNGQNILHGGIIANANSKNCILDNENTYAGSYILNGTHTKSTLINGIMQGNTYILWAKSNWDSNPLIKRGKIRLYECYIGNFFFNNFAAIGYSAYYNGIELYNCTIHNIDGNWELFGSFIYFYDCKISNSSIRTGSRKLLKTYQYFYRTELRNCTQGSSDTEGFVGGATLDNVVLHGCTLNGTDTGHIVYGVDSNNDGDISIGENDRFEIGNSFLSFDGTNWITEINGTNYIFNLTEQ